MHRKRKHKISRVKRWRITVNEILNGGRHWESARLSRRFITVLVIVDLVGIFFNNAPALIDFRREFTIAGYVSGLAFLAEYLLRIWSAGVYYNDKSRKYAGLRYVFSFFGIIDFVAILPFLLPVVFPASPDRVHLVDFARLFLVFKLWRYSRSLDLIKNAFRSVRTELWTGISAAMVIVTFAAVIMYYLEKDAQPRVFDNVGQGFWWSIITFTTVGYGDIYPITPWGKFLAGVIAVAGIGMIAMPTGIISSAFMAQVARRRTIRYLPSATCYTAHLLRHDRRPAPAEDGEYCPHCGKKLPRRDNNRG